MMFDVGQKVICVRRQPWRLFLGRQLFDPHASGPKFAAECTIDAVVPNGVINLEGGMQDGVRLREWTGLDDLFAAKWFRPKDPDIEALRSLVTKLTAKQPEEV